MPSRRVRMQVTTACVASEVSLRPGTYNGEEGPDPAVTTADCEAASDYWLWPTKHIFPVKVTSLVQQGFIRPLD